MVRGDQARFRREREARWEERRLAVYADYARVLKTAVTLAYRVASQLGNDPHPHPLPPEEAAPLIAEAATARDAAGEALLLLGSPEVVERARDWVTCVMEMERFLREETRDPAAWQALYLAVLPLLPHYVDRFGLSTFEAAVVIAAYPISVPLVSLG